MPARFLPNTGKREPHDCIYHLRKESFFDMSYFSVVSVQIIIFLVYATIGIIARKTNILHEQSLDMLARFIIKISLPIMIFMYTINGATKETFLSALPILPATACLYVFLATLASILSRVFRLQGNEKNVYRACVMFGNIGFMGIPIICAVFPEHGMLYIGLFTIIDQFLQWTVGVNLTTPIDGGAPPLRARLMKMVNPSTVGIVLALIAIFAEVRIPEPVNGALMTVGSITTPLALIYLGALFSGLKISASVQRIEFYGSIVCKMCLFPIFFCQFLRWWDLPEDMIITLCLLSSMPTMVALAMLAKTQRSAGDYAAAMIFVATLSSIVTIPLVCFFLRS